MTDQTSDDGGLARTWFGFPQSSEVINGRETEVVTVPASMWSDEHRRRLLQTQAIDGLVPTVAVRRTYETARALQLPPPGRSLSDSLDSRSVSGFDEIVSATEAASEAVHAGHLTGLVHGALGTDDIRVIGNEIAVAGMGLGHGGTPEVHRRHFVAPEVLAGAVPTVRSDIYSLGRILESGLSRMQGTAPADALALIAEATDADPSKRPPSANSVAQRLGQLSGRRRRRYGLAALGSSSGARALSTAVNAESGAGAGRQLPDAGAPGVAAATGVAVGGAAAGAVAAGSSGFVASQKETNTAEAVQPKPLAAATGASGGRRAAAIALVGLAGLGGVGLWALSRDNDSSDNQSVEQVQTSVSPSSGTEAPSSTTPTTAAQTTAAPTTAAPTTTTTTAPTSTTAAPTTTEAPTTAAPTTAAPADDDADDQADDAPPVAAVLAASEAADVFEILHAVPDTAVDAYIDGELVAAAFMPGNLAGPLPMSTNGKPLDLFAAQEDPPLSVDDRDDKPILAGPIAVDGPGTLVAFVDGQGTPMVQAFGNNLDPVPPGVGRLALRHVASFGSASIVVDGEEMATDVPAGASLVVDLPAGPHELKVIDADGGEVLKQEINAGEGELTSVWIRGDAGDVTTSIRRINGLQTAPAGIPSGDSGLVDDPFDAVGQGLVPAVLVMVALGTAGIYVQRRRALNLNAES